ncbi:MAG: hypothetical protein KGQ26_00055 [Rhodospirillales bacterium]|nr:hypothetical protein [Rhodospirillales bacterium]MDE2318446.1 hypothetical protein [Rhodospirillales bacterium]
MKHLALAALAALTPALAKAAPSFLPTRDVTVNYTLSSPAQAAGAYQLSYNAAQQLARVDGPNGYYILANLPAAQAQIVLPALHAIVQAPDFSALTAEIYQADNAKFTPIGTGQYAGLECRKYLVTDQHGTAHACITPDGVVLHFTGQNAQGGTDVTATSVTFAPQAPGLFAAPPGYAPLNLPPGALQALLQPQG